MRCTTQTYLNSSKLTHMIIPFTGHDAIIWPKLLQVDFGEFMAFHNGVCMQRQKEKPGPSDMLCNEAFGMLAKCNGHNCLLPIDVDIVSQIKDSSAKHMKCLLALMLN